jgi:hypothetical protein
MQRGRKGSVVAPLPRWFCPMDFPRTSVHTAHMQCPDTTPQEALPVYHGAHRPRWIYSKNHSDGKLHTDGTLSDRATIVCV